MSEIVRCDSQPQPSAQYNNVDYRHNFRDDFFLLSINHACHLNFPYNLRTLTWSNHKFYCISNWQWNPTKCGYFHHWQNIFDLDNKYKFDSSIRLKLRCSESIFFFLTETHSKINITLTVWCVLFNGSTRFDGAELSRIAAKSTGEFRTLNAHQFSVSISVIEYYEHNSVDSHETNV